MQKEIAAFQKAHEEFVVASDLVTQTIKSLGQYRERLDKASIAREVALCNMEAVIAKAAPNV